MSGCAVECGGELVSVRAAVAADKIIILILELEILISNFKLKMKTQDK